MSFRIIERTGSEVLEARIYRDSGFAQYQVRFYRDGVAQPEATYFTCTLADARDTARTVVCQPASA